MSESAAVASDERRVVVDADVAPVTSPSIFLPPGLLVVVSLDPPLMLVVGCDESRVEESGTEDLAFEAVNGAGVDVAILPSRCCCCCCSY